MFGSGLWSAISGVGTATLGAATAIVGAAAIPVPVADISSPLFIAGGLTLEGYGAMNVRDGVSMMQSAVDGRFRGSTLGDIGGGLFGPRGREWGENLTKAISLGSITNSGARALLNGSARSGIDAAAELAGMKDPQNIACSAGR
jgi:hypothetical protein